MQAAFRHVLESGDVEDFRAIQARCFPHQYQPKTDEEAAFSLHYARTQADFLSLRHRAWSHRWLLERGYPSGLPDALKPKAERLYPRIAEGVGIAVKTSSALLKPAAKELQRVMGEAVEDIYADDPHPNPALVSARMAEARAIEERRLFGIFGSLSREARG